MKLKEKSKELIKDIPAIFLSLKSKETSIMAKVLAAVTIIYALSPIDLIPDFIPILGYVDDLIILPILIALTISLIPRETLSCLRKDSEEIWKNGKPKNWYYAIPIALVWASIVVMIIHRYILERL